MRLPRHTGSGILVALVACLAIPRTAAPQSPDDVYWSPSFDAPAFDSAIQDFAIFGGDLVAVGTFGQSPDGPAAGIARWDGTQWSPFDSGVHGGIWAAVEFQGSLIVGGAFDVAGSDSVQNVARWDGASWHRMGAGVQGQVFDLAVIDDELYAAGDFTVNATFEHAPIVRWNGIGWEAIGPLVPSAVFASARVIVDFGGSLVVGGRFRRNGGATGLVLLWNGSDWDTLATGSGSVISLAVDGSTLVAGGLFTFAEGGSGPIARWNGVSWTSELPLFNGVSYDLRSLSGGLYVAGQLTAPPDVIAVGRLTGTGLEPLPPISGIGYALAEYRGQIFAGGLISAAEVSPNFQETMFHCVRLGSDGWEPVGGVGRDGYGLMGLPIRAAYALLPIGDHLYVGGSFIVARNGAQWVPTGTVARWDGSSWTGFPDLEGTVLALAWYGGGLVAGGSFTGANGILNLAVWSGTDWLPFGGGTDDEVCSLVASGSDLYVGGRFQMAGGVPAPGIALWDGNSWSPVGAVDLSPPTPVVHSLLLRGSDLIAAGLFTQMGGVAANNVARWNGVDWSPFGAGYPGEAFGMVDFEGDLVGCGYPFVGAAQSPILRWTGTLWEPLGSGTGWGVRCLRVANGSLYAGGDFLDLSAPGVDLIARWDGVRWVSLGSGLEHRVLDYSVVHAMAEFEGSLYVAGGFNSAGGKPSSLIARWDGLVQSVPGPGPRLSMGAGRPNPFADQVQIDYQLRSPAHVTIRVHDLTGRRVYQVPRGLQGIGNYAVDWDGRNDDHRRQPAGVYYVSVQADDEDPLSRTVVLLP